VARVRGGTDPGNPSDSHNDNDTRSADPAWDTGASAVGGVGRACSRPHARTHARRARCGSAAVPPPRADRSCDAAPNLSCGGRQQRARRGGGLRAPCPCFLLALLLLLLLAPACHEICSGASRCENPPLPPTAHALPTAAAAYRLARFTLSPLLAALAAASPGVRLALPARPCAPSRFVSCPPRALPAPPAASACDNVAGALRHHGGASFLATPLPASPLACARLRAAVLLALLLALLARACRTESPPSSRLSSSTARRERRRTGPALRTPAPRSWLLLVLLPAALITSSRAQASAPCRISKIDPGGGPSSGGTSVTIVGSNLTGTFTFASAHTFCRWGAGDLVKPTFVSATRIICVSPPSASVNPERVTLHVTNDGGYTFSTDVMSYFYEGSSGGPGGSVWVCVRVRACKGGRGGGVEGGQSVCEDQRGRVCSTAADAG